MIDQASFARMSFVRYSEVTSDLKIVSPPFEKVASHIMFHYIYIGKRKRMKNKSARAIN